MRKIPVHSLGRSIGSWEHKVLGSRRIIGSESLLLSASSQRPDDIIRRYKSSSSSASLLDFVPNAVRTTVKSSLLSEVSKPDFWKQPNGHNGLNGDSGDHATTTSHNHHRSGGVNGSAAHATIDSIDHAQTDFEDPLDQWYLHRETVHWPNLPPGVATNVEGTFALAKKEMKALSQSIRNDLIRTDHPVLHKAASYFFEDADGGKKVRPMMVCLLSRALSDDSRGRQEHSSTLSSQTSGGSSSSFWTAALPNQRQDLSASQRRLAEISEMIHTASLFHDDVIDGADTRRNKPTVHQVFGNKMAILAGDYLLARASISLARLRDTAVVECMSTIIEHLVRGEVMQMTLHQQQEDEDRSSSSNGLLEHYLAKNYYKTASLMANSCRSAALLGSYPSEVIDASYRFGKHMGIAFQLVDDVLDFCATEEEMGKPPLGDLRAGLATAPVLFALDSAATTTTNTTEGGDGGDELQRLMERKFSEIGDVERAAYLVREESNAIEETKQLARAHAELAVEAVMSLSASPFRDALVHLAYKVVDRTR